MSQSSLHTKFILLRIIERNESGVPIKAEIFVDLDLDLNIQPGDQFISVLVDPLSLAPPH